MRGCRHCGCHELEVIRESRVQRRGSEFMLRWYTCAGCQDVSFSYRRIPAVPVDANSSAEEGAAPEAVGATGGAPALAR